MPTERIPLEPLGFIQRCVRERRLVWTYHVNIRLRGRFIPRAEILAAVDSYEIVEAYPEDKYLPSYLIRAVGERSLLHILFAVDTEGEHVRIVTAYRPNPDRWSDDARRRR